MSLLPESPSAAAAPPESAPGAGDIELPVRQRPGRPPNQVRGGGRLSLKTLHHLARSYRRRLGRLAQPLMFLAVGGSGMIVDLLVLTCLLVWLDFRPARALAIGVAMTWNFALNRRYTFLGARSGPLLRQYLLFCLSCGLGAVVNWSVSSWLWSRWGDVLRFPALAAMSGIAAGVVLNYLLSARLVFRPPGNSSTPQG